MISPLPSIISKIGHALKAAFVDLKQSRSENSADCVFIIGPGNAEDISVLEGNARHLNIHAHFIGDGIHPITEEMIQDARRKGVIGKDTEVVCINHGEVIEREGRPDQHLLLVGKRPGSDTRWVSTASVLQWLRQPLPSDPTSMDQPESWKGNVHFMACKVGSFGKQLTTPGTSDAEAEARQAVWRQGHVILHGSSKLLATETSRENCMTLMREIAHAKHHNNGKLDLVAMLENLAVNATDTITMVGGELEQAVIIRAPKRVLDLLPGAMLAKLRQQEALAKLSPASSPNDQGAVSGPAVRRLAAPKRETGTISEKKLANYLQTRLMHLRSREKLDQLKSDLHQFPGLTNLRFALNTSPLIFACLHPYPENQGVRVTEIVQMLLDSGASVNSIDAFGASALHHAARRGEPSLIALLALRGAEGALRDKSGRTALHWACEAGKNAPSSVQALLKNVTAMDVNRTDKRGMTPLHLAIKAGDAATVNLLLAAGADPTKGLWFWESPAKMAERLGNQHLSDQLKQAARRRRQPAEPGPVA